MLLRLLTKELEEAEEGVGVALADMGEGVICWMFFGPGGRSANESRS